MQDILLKPGAKTTSLLYENNCGNQPLRCDVSFEDFLHL